MSEITHLETENAELKAENAKLREERNHWKVEQTHAYSNWEDAHKRVTEVEAENAKLQELVEDMWLDGMCECDERLTCDKCEYHYTDRMRELGIEVD